MVKAVQRDGFDTVEEAGRGAIRTIGKGLFAAGVVGAALTGLAALAVSGIAAAVVTGGGLAWGTVAVASLVGGAVAATGTGVAALAGAPIVAPIAGMLGLFGLAKGANKASKENHAYAQKMAQNPSLDQARLVEAQNEALRKGFEAGQQQGFVAGGQHVIQQLQAAQEAQQQMMAAQAPQEPATNHAQKLGRPSMSAEDHAKHIIAQREAQQAAGAHLA